MKNEDQHMEFREQVVKYLAGEMSPSEQKLFEENIEADEEKKSLFSEFSGIWDGVDHLAARNKFDIDAEWDLLSGKIDFAETPVKMISLRKQFLRIAAAILIGAVGLAGWYGIRNLSSYEQVALEQGIQKIDLPDGSIVTINTGSSLKYSLDENSENRKIKLSGEAFFEVARDTARPFIIDAGSATVEVLGTSFNVKALEETEIVEVTVATGLVAMAVKRNADNLIILNPGNSGVYNETKKKLELISKADPNALAWKTRDIVFSETPLSEVISVINHVYQSNLKIADNSIASCPITVTFSQQELSAVISVISATLDLKLSREGDAIILSGEGCN